MRKTEKTQKQKNLLTEGEIGIYRTLIALSAVITPVFSAVWLHYYSDSLIGIAAPALSAYYILLTVLSYKSRYVMQRINYPLHASYYFITAFALYIGFLTGFSEPYALLLTFICFYITLTFNKMAHLIGYLVFTALLTAVFAFTSAGRPGAAADNFIISAVCFAGFSAVFVFNIYIRSEFRKDLQNSYEDQKRFLDLLPEGVIVYDKSKVVYANPAFMNIIKRTGIADVFENSVTDLVNASEQEGLLKDIDTYFVTGRQLFSERRYVLKNNEAVDLEFLSAMTAYRGKKAVISTVKDITERKATLRKLTEAEGKYRSLVEGALAGVFIRQNEQIVYINPYIEKLLGYSLHEMQDAGYLGLVFEEDRPQYEKALQLLRDGAGQAGGEMRMTGRDGSRLHVQFKITDFLYNGSPACIGTLIDITNLKEAEEKIRTMAYYDSLTGLPNRNTLKERIEKSIAENRSGVSVMFIDFDRFKMVNDTLGHETGDSLLREATKRLGECVNGGDFLCRYGGDEFIIVMNGTRENADHASRRILQKFRSPFKVGGIEVFITPSIGVSMAPEDSTDPETLVKYADIAMYYAKKQGRNTCKFYFKKMNADVSRMMKLEYGMVRAIENGEFEIYYQPVIDIESTAIVSAEALLRWNHPEFGVVSSLEFIPIAEETGQIVRLGNWVLENACRQNKLWQDAGMPKAAVCVNVSRRQLKDSCFVNIVCGVLKETGLDPKYLELEITESILHDSGDHMQVLKELKAAGVRIAIDDFGSGYSSLGALQYMDVDSLKIDRDIIRSVADSRKSEAIVGMVVQLGKSLGLRVIAEGIEDERQRTKLKDLSCDCGQGYLFSRPVSAKDFEKLITDAVDARLLQ